MFSRRSVLIVGVILVIAVNLVFLSVTSTRHSSFGPGRIVLTLISPFQSGVTHTIHFFRSIWGHYFNLVNVSKKNQELQQQLRLTLEKNHALKEVELTNTRLRSLLNFKEGVARKVLPAEVVGMDPSPWFRSIMIDKGYQHGIRKGLPVVVSEGVAGQVTDVAHRYAKVLLIIDQNSSMDALVQRTRARGIVSGGEEQNCLFRYVLRKEDVKIGDTVVSSGLDGVFPKGLRVGEVSGVVKRSAGIFQEVMVAPYADFEKLEEVLVIMNPSVVNFSKEQ
ncbi:Rod shape-determining protein MreC [Olavius algarvensis associated proteobacterium Delta 3]|nr:Rod shape-determining protein MreC [Olavius algarvensis associated proteobacterium Delta 3]